ncbi:MAG: formylglycine-generating enzyme family protein [Saprospiraceae bacterium]|nr:formylglycine-generating enzyme family protein [Saprospiraceae bacterium]
MKNQYPLVILMAVSLVLLTCQNDSIQQQAGLMPNMQLIPAGHTNSIANTRSSKAIAPFFLDEKEVTNADFAAFVEATGYLTTAEKDLDWEQIKEQFPPNTPPPPDSLLKAGALVFRPEMEKIDLQNELSWWRWEQGANWKHPEGMNSNIESRQNHPVVQISHADARAYCQWKGKRLPTEAEWEWAAMGGASSSIYPWGDKSPDQAYDKANFWQGPFPWKDQELDGFASTTPVGHFPGNGYGLYDMAGNVWEWCADPYQAKPGSPVLANHFVIRGGSFLCAENYCSGYQTRNRLAADGQIGSNHTGCRCAQDIDN